MTELVDSIRERYEQTLQRIAAAARSVGRDPSSVRLVVVTKSQPREVVEAAIQAGATILGENYPEEAVEKIQSIAAQSAVEWHMIGHVQSRKARLVPANFNLMQSLDSLKLAERLDRFAAEAGRVLPVLLEFNVGGEDSKSGWPAADESRWDALAASLNPVFDLPHLEVRGLMVMPPIGDTAEASRPFFQHTRRLQSFLRERLPQVDWSELSMGTSTDFEVAVQEGATLARVGTAIVGPRNYNKS
ncbi:MAG: YggS family pyridoxal phosphate-dependent enzyme [Chloroflexi bacterium]|nr:YggS family pyridoxal phosphate-dependent enzyme [Chloroflexota bacterium]